MFKYVITAVLFCQYILQCFLTQTRTVHLYSVQCTSKVYFNNGLNWWSWSSSTENSIFQVLSSYKNLSCTCTVIQYTYVLLLSLSSYLHLSCPCPVICMSLIPAQLYTSLLSPSSYTYLSCHCPVIHISIVPVQLYVSLLSQYVSLVFIPFHLMILSMSIYMYHSCQSALQLHISFLSLSIYVLTSL